MVAGYKFHTGKRSRLEVTHSKLYFKPGLNQTQVIRNSQKNPERGYTSVGAAAAPGRGGRRLKSLDNHHFHPERMPGLRHGSLKKQKDPNQTKPLRTAVSALKTAQTFLGLLPR